MRLINRGIRRWVKQYTEREKTRYVAEWQASGQSAAGFAAAKGIKETTFYTWSAQAKKRTQGGDSSCFLFSLIESAKENGLNPQVYLTHVFTKACRCTDAADWHKLLPWNCQLETPHPAGKWL